MSFCVQGLKFWKQPKNKVSFHRLGTNSDKVSYSILFKTSTELSEWFSSIIIILNKSHQSDYP